MISVVPHPRHIRSVPGSNLRRSILIENFHIRRFTGLKFRVRVPYAICAQHFWSTAPQRDCNLSRGNSNFKVTKRPLSPRWADTFYHRLLGQTERYPELTALGTRSTLVLA
jgi:hypothetical protein